MTDNVQKVLGKLKWMREQKIWPNGLRYLWTDAHGVCALVSLYRELKVLAMMYFILNHWIKNMLNFYQKNKVYKN